MSNQKSLEDIRNGIFLPELGDGAWRCDRLAGQTTDPCLPDHHHASRLVRQDNNEDMQMTDTSHHTGSGWSRPSGLLSSLASRFQPQSRKTTGSMIYSMGWKQKVTPRGRSYYQLAASARRTFDSDFGLWAGWVTASSRDWKDTPGMATEGKDGRKRLDQLPRQAYLSGWPTPQTMDTLPPMDYETRLNHPSRQGRSVSGNLREVVTIAQATRRKPDGTILTGSSAEMENGGLLNPAHSRWLMGYPPEWDACAVTAMPSSPKSQRKS